jgi:Ig-like domain from next to BRCA1 gene
MKATILSTIGSMLFATATALAGNNSAFVSQSVPSTMEAGRSYRVSMTFKNTGDTIWKETGGVGSYRLGARNPDNNTIWRANNRVNLAMGAKVRPGSAKTFSFDVVAPAQAGRYNLQWGMVHEGVGHWFGSKSANVSVNVTEGPVSFGFDSTRVHTTRVRGSNLHQGIGGIYLIGSADGSDAQGRSVISVGGSNGYMKSDNPATIPPPPYKLTWTRVSGNILKFKAEVGPVPINFATMSMPFDFDQHMVDSFAFNGTSYRLQCTTSDGTKRGSGERYDTAIPPKCEIRNTENQLLGLVGAAQTGRPTTWGEVSGSFGKVLVTVKHSSHYRQMVFHNHFGTHNLELSFGSMAKGETAMVEGTIEVTTKP